MNKKFKCLVCGKAYVNDFDLYQHIEDKHGDFIPKDFTPAQYHYYLKTGREYGTCIICKENTKWNPVTNKYHRFCSNPKCKDKYREEFKKRMITKYGKIHLLDDPDQQRKMLANRSISGVYTWANGGQTTYTGSYEYDFLRFLDVLMNYDPSDIMSPSPHTYYYEYKGERKFYIPDFFIPSLNLEIEIKDGGDNPNKHHKIQSVDKEKEKLKDDVLRSQKEFSYIKITNKNYDTFFEFLSLKKEEFSKNKSIDNPIFIIKESMNDLIVEEPVNESLNKDKEKIPIYVLLTHSGTLLANIIKKATKDPYSHVSISFDTKLNEMYSFGRKYKNNPLVGTFVKENIKEGLYEEVSDTATYSLYTTFVTEEEYNSIKDKLNSFKFSEKEFKYNFVGLITNKLGIETERKDAYFCSEFVSLLLSQDTPILNKHHSLVKPYDFAKNKKFHFITKGLLKNYSSEKVNRIMSSKLFKNAR